MSRFGKALKLLRENTLSERAIRMKKVIFAICLAWGLILLSSHNTYTCSCSNHFTPLIVHYSGADSVFVGKVINIKKFGNKSEKEAWFPKHRTVEFEIQKAYKGMDSSKKRIVLNTNFNAASCGFAEYEAPKSGQKWIVFMYKNEEENRFYFDGMCNPSSHIKKVSHLSEYEDDITSVKEKQAIIGTVVDDMKIEGIKDIEVILEGEGQNLTTRTNEKGLYYFPVTFKGKYKITINISFPAFLFATTFIIKENQIKENASENAKPLKNILTYDVQLKDGEFNYNEINIFVIQPKEK